MLKVSAGRAVYKRAGVSQRRPYLFPLSCVEDLPSL
jgi:hypothetical protein